MPRLFEGVWLNSRHPSPRCVWIVGSERQLLTPLCRANSEPCRANSEHPTLPLTPVNVDLHPTPPIPQGPRGHYPAGGGGGAAAPGARAPGPGTRALGYRGGGVQVHIY